MQYLFPMSRVAFMVCNLTSPKIVDGIGKLVTKTDLASLKSKSQLIQLHSMEEMLQTLWKKAIAHGISKNMVCKSLGKGMIRAALFVLHKQKQSREGVEYESIGLIQEAFEKDLADECLDVSSSKEALPQTLVTMEEVKSPTFIAMKKVGLEVGSLFTLVDHEDHVWVCADISEDKTTFVHTDVLTQSKTAVFVAAADLCEKVKKPS